jgi:hypothetical protein
MHTVDAVDGADCASPSAHGQAMVSTAIAA